MLNRRVFIEAGAAASLAAALGTPSGGSHGAPAGSSSARVEAHHRIGASQRVPVHAVVFDERFTAARRFGETARRLGSLVLPIRADVTELWSSQLYPLWRQAPAPVAGITAYAAMFCLERLAWDHGLRMVHRRASGEPAAAGYGDGGPGGIPERPQTEPSLHAWLIATPAQLAVTAFPPYGPP